MLLGGTEDTTTPVSSFIAVWDGILEEEEFPSNGPGGLLAVIQGGSHKSEAWGVDAEGDTLPTLEAALFDFGRFQRVTEDFGPTTRYCIPALRSVDAGYLDDCLE